MTDLERIYAKVESLRVPLNILIELTNRCNEDCIHCFIKEARDKFSLSQDDRELDFNQISALFGELAREGTLNLIFTGGEAMLRGDFFQIARLAKDKNFAVTL
ncbi:MAG: radical SAM protein, partial [Candidatus Omnitrophica bacterium]|nr:radical SAM protein [Candidatus Omnitrophota bacterium]